MKITCPMAEDLLPLYVEDACSNDSRKALEAHIKDCPNCRDVYTRMTAPEMPVAEAAPLVDCGRKIKRRRTAKRILLAILIPVLAAFLALSALALQDMRRQANPTVYETEVGTWNLTAAPLETTADAVSGYVFCTNNEKLTVTSDQPGTVWLAPAENPEARSLCHTLDKEDYSRRSGTYSADFTNLSSSHRYVVICEDMGHAQVTVSEGRIINFWYSLANVFVSLLSL